MDNNLDIIKCADWVIDPGPDADDKEARLYLLELKKTLRGMNFLSPENFQESILFKK
jgi:hypothetical protein